MITITTEQTITSLIKSPCFLFSASIALSSMPPTVALHKSHIHKSILIKKIMDLFIGKPKDDDAYLWPITNRIIIPFSSSNFFNFSPIQELLESDNIDKEKSRIGDTEAKNKPTNLEASM